MFDQKLVILVVLGVAIYLLTKPSSHSKNNAPAPAPTAPNDVLPSNLVTENQEKVVTKEPFRNLERFGTPRQHLGVRDESQPENYTVEDIVAAEEKETQQKMEKETEVEPKVKAHVNKQKINSVDTGNAFGKLLPAGTDPNAMPDTEKDSKFNKDDFLPKKSGKKWFDTVVDLDDSALLTAKPETIIGIDTKGQSLRNASFDLRGEIGLANPKKKFVWNNSTISHDDSRRSMTIGGCDKN